MPEFNTSLPRHFMSSTQRIDWWHALPQVWKQAISDSVIDNISATKTPDDQSLINICRSPTLRIVGNTGPNPTTNVALKDLTAIAQLTQLQILIVSFVGLESLAGVESLHRLVSLFVHNNALHNLNPLHKLTHLEELYCQDNQIQSLTPLSKCTNLRTLLCHYNALTNFEGITEAHARRLEHFYCQPNKDLDRREIIRMERDVGIICRKG